MSNERDELADVIGTVTDNWDEPLDSVHDIPQIVNAILAAGYRRPSTVTTAAELDALPNGSIIQLGIGFPAYSVKRADERNWWLRIGTDALLSSDVLADIYPLPATVIHEPTA